MFISELILLSVLVQQMEVYFCLSALKISLLGGSRHETDDIGARVKTWI